MRSYTFWDFAESLRKLRFHLHSLVSTRFQCLSPCYERPFSPLRCCNLAIRNMTQKIRKMNRVDKSFYTLVCSVFRIWYHSKYLEVVSDFKLISFSCYFCLNFRVSVIYDGQKHILCKRRKNIKWAYYECCVVYIIYLYILYWVYAITKSTKKTKKT